MKLYTYLQKNKNYIYISLHKLNAKWFKNLNLKSKMVHNYRKTLIINFKLHHIGKNFEKKSQKAQKVATSINK